MKQHHGGIIMATLEQLQEIAQELFNRIVAHYRKTGDFSELHAFIEVWTNAATDLDQIVAGQEWVNTHEITVSNVG